MIRWRHQSLTWAQLIRRQNEPLEQQGSSVLPLAPPVRHAADRLLRRRPSQGSRSTQQRPAAALPAPSQTDLLSLANAEATRRSLRPGFPVAAPVDRTVGMALRLQAGRTHECLVRLMDCGLLKAHSATTGSSASLEPAVGLSGLFGGQDVLVLATFAFRGVQQCDVVPVLERAGPGDASHTINCRSGAQGIAKRLLGLL